MLAKLSSACVCFVLQLVSARLVFVCLWAGGCWPVCVSQVFRFLVVGASVVVVLVSCVIVHELVPPYITKHTTYDQNNAFL